jgi:MFS family permease
MQYFFETAGWRATYIGIGIFSVLAAVPLSLVLRRRPPPARWTVQPATSEPAKAAQPSPQPLGLSPGSLQTMLCAAGIACCVAMSMPQVHMVAYCGDLGYAAARGAEMLSLMLGFGIVSRLVSGWLSDRIGGLRTLMVNSVLQFTALLAFLPSSQLGALYAASALFGLFQGGLIPSYAIIVREYFAPREAGWRTGTLLMATLFGMALGGWMAGAIFDLTGSYRASFANAIAWNLLNMSIVFFLLRRARRYLPAAAAA